LWNEDTERSKFTGNFLPNFKRTFNEHKPKCLAERLFVDAPISISEGDRMITTRMSLPELSHCVGARRIVWFTIFRIVRMA
jgi:hypothetical protein